MHWQQCEQQYKACLAYKSRRELERKWCLGECHMIPWSRSCKLHEIEHERHGYVKRISRNGRIQVESPTEKRDQGGEGA